MNLATQILDAYKDDIRVFRLECVTGGSDHVADKNRFAIMRACKKVAKFNTCHLFMDDALLFTKEGKAVHQCHGEIPLSVIRSASQNLSGWFGSNGCVKLTEPYSRALYNRA